MSKTNFIGDPNLLLSQFTKSNISLRNRFVEKNEYKKLYLDEWFLWRNYYDYQEIGRQNPNSINELVTSLYILGNDIIMLMNKKRRRFKNYVEQISEVLMKIDSLVNKYVDNEFSDENVFAALRSKHKQTTSKKHKDLKKALYIELEILLATSFKVVNIPVSRNSQFSVLHKNECMISFLGIEINHQSM